MAYLDLTIRGGTKEEKKLVSEMVEYCVVALNLYRMNLEINVQIKKLTDAFGYCAWEDNNIRPREFTIEIAKGMSKKKFLTTLAHEMVHVKQYVRGEIRERFQSDHRVFWKDKDHSDTTYWSQPWEKEAFRLQDKLYKDFKNA